LNIITALVTIIVIYITAVKIYIFLLI